MQNERSADGQSERDETKQPKPAAGGEDESSTEKEGDDGHLHDDQKSRTLGD